MNIPKRTKIILAVVCYFAAVILYVSVTYIQTNQYLLKIVDDKLLVAANMATNVLHNQLHDNLLGTKPVTENEDFLLAMELKSLAEKLKVAYIYSVVEDSGAILFVSSSPTQEEQGTGIYSPVFLTQYTEADSAIFQAFSTDQLQFSQYKDRWGHFRSVFVPLSTLDGGQFVVGVDVDISEVVAASIASVFWALAIAIILALISVPLLFLLIGSVKKQAEAEVAYLYSDETTGIENKNKLIKDLTHSFNNHLALIEIDDFSSLINALGITQSDALKTEVAQRLKQMHFTGISNVRVYAVKADQFALLVNDIVSQEVLNEGFRSVFDYIQKRKYYLGQEDPIAINVRVGAVRDQENPLLLAGLALSQAKAENKELVFYDEEIHLPKVYRSYLSNKSRFITAMDNNKVRPFYQPIFEVNAKKIVKYEALARVVDDYNNVIMLPDEFMSIAYQSQLGHVLTLHILDCVIHDIQYEEHVVCINLSVSDIKDHRTRKAIIEKLHQSGLGEKIEFEILENQMIDDYKPIIKFIRHLKLLGSKVGIDDLGKHYSNLDRLLNLPIDFVKIDGSIISSIEYDEGACDIVRKIVEYSSAKKVEVIAEFCSSHSICKRVVVMGVDYLQGYYVGRPSSGFAKDGIELDYEVADELA